MELSMTGVVGRVVQEHEDMRHRSLEKLAKSRKLATKAVEKASLLLQPKAAQKAEEVAKGQTQVDRVARCLKEETRELEELVEDWSSAYGDLSKELVLIGDLKDWAETIELRLRSIKAELEHSKGCMESWQRMKDQEQR